MAHHYAEIAEEIGEPIREYADGDAYFWFMEGSWELSQASDEDAPAMFASWLKGAVDRLDMLVNHEAAVKVMQHHGRICARMHPEHLEKVLSERHGSESLEAYIDGAEGLTREGDIVYSDYGLTPEPSGMRCYCSFWQPLPPDEHISLTWCNCAAGHIASVWEHLLGAPVEVDVLESCMSGGNACRFAIHLPEGWRESPAPA